MYNVYIYIYNSRIPQHYSRKGQFFLLGVQDLQIPSPAENLAHIKPYLGGCIPLT